MSPQQFHSETRKSNCAVDESGGAFISVVGADRIYALFYMLRKVQGFEFTKFRILLSTPDEIKGHREENIGFRYRIFSLECGS
jgi:hypothetical protein